MNTRGFVTERTCKDESDDLDCEKEGILELGNSSIWGGNKSYKVKLSGHKFEWTQTHGVEIQTNQIDFDMYSCNVSTVPEETHNT